MFLWCFTSSGSNYQSEFHILGASGIVLGMRSKLCLITVSFYLHEVRAVIDIWTMRTRKHEGVLLVIRTLNHIPVDLPELHDIYQNIFFSMNVVFFGTNLGTTLSFLSDLGRWVIFCSLVKKCKDLELQVSCFLFSFLLFFLLQYIFNSWCFITCRFVL